jgi:hypothetical protein
MSGGHFSYSTYSISCFVDEIEQLILDNNNVHVDINEQGQPISCDVYEERYSPSTIIRFKEAIRVLELAQMYAQRIDYLVSGDDSEESFHERLDEGIMEFNKQHEGDV